MAHTRAKIIVPLLFVAGLILVYMIQNPFQGEIKHAEEGGPVPDFQLQDLQGKDVRLSDFRGKIVFLNFWATWCPPCREEMPSMEELYRAMRGRPFVMLAVSVDNDPEQVRRFQKASAYSFPILLDHENRVAALYGTTGVPETFLIGPDGSLVFRRIIGPRDWMHPESLAAIEKAVAKTEEPPPTAGQAAAEQ